MFEEIFFDVKRIPLKENGIDSKHKFKIINADTGKIISIVSNRYSLIKNIDIHNLISETLGAKLYKHVTNGSVFHLDYLIEEKTAEIKKGDIVQLMLSVTNSYDGSKKFEISVNAIRLICMNGVKIGELIYSSKFIHKSITFGSIVKEILEALSHLSEKLDILVSKIKPLTKMKMTNDKKMAFIKVISKYPDYIKDGLIEEVTTQKINNMYDLLNVVTYFTTHTIDVDSVAKNEIITKLHKEIINL